MKKRLLSMLLAAALAVSAVPAMALAVTADEGATTQNLLADIKPAGTTVVADATADGSNNYLHVGDRRTIGDGSGVVFDLASAPGTGVYYLEFDARNSVDGEKVPTPKHVRIASTSDVWTFVSVSDQTTNEDGTLKYGSSNDGFYSINLGNDWRHYVLTFSGNLPAFCARICGRSTGETINFDMDNIRIYKEGSTEDIISWDFEDGLPEAATDGGSIRYTATSWGGFSSVLTHEDYNHSDSGAVTYNVTGVDAGVYTLTGNVRYAYSYNYDEYDKISNAISATVTATAVVDGKEFAVGTYNVTKNDWVAVNGEFTLPYNAELAEISLVTTVKDASGNVLEETPLDFKNMSLVCEPIEAPVQADLIAVESGELDGVTPTFGDAKYYSGVTDAEAGDFNRVEGWAENTTITYEDVTLIPGEYTFTADTRVAGNDSAANITVAVGDVVEGPTAINATEWTTVGSTFTIYEETVADIVIAADGAKVIDYKNVSLSFEEIEVPGLTDTLVDTDNLLNGATVTSKASKLTQRDSDALYIPERLETSSNHFMKFIVPGDFKAGETYYLTFDASIEDLAKTGTTKGLNLRMGVGQTTYTGFTSSVTTTEASITPITITPSADLSSIWINVNHGGYSTDISAMWIDNLWIYKEVDGKKVTVFEYSFDDVNNVVEGGTYSNAHGTYNIVKFDDLVVYCKVAPEIIPNYFDIAATNAISLNVDAANIELNAADYDFTTGVMALDSGKTGTAHAVITLSNGETTETITTDTVNVDDAGYAEIAERFTVADGYYIESIDIITDIVGNVRILTPVVELATYGDADGDGEVGATDATLLAKYIAKLDASEDIDLTVLDVYHDGVVNSLDLIVIARYLGGWEDYATLPYFPAE